MKLFQPTDTEHKNIVLAAIIAADVFGRGRITSAKEQLEMNGITAYSTVVERDVFERFVFNCSELVATKAESPS